MIRYPQPSDYQMAIQTPKAVFADPELKNSTVELNPLRMPVVSSGGFALSFFLTTANGQKLVVRCFKAYSQDRHERYSAISRFLDANRHPIFLDVDYLEKGILVNGTWYPIVRMPRVDGVTLQRYIDKELEAKRDISVLPVKFRRLVDTLEAKGVAHGDLQHGNIMVQKNGELVLVDYDGMYVPTLAGRENPERGHPSYQHRDRNRQFSPELDRFSSIVIDLGLRAIVADPTLWKRYDNGENILFREKDLVEPDKSDLMRDLEQNKAIGTQIAAFRTLCIGPYDSIPRLADFIANKVASLPLDQIIGRDRMPLLRGTRAYDATNGAELLNHVGEWAVVIGKLVGPTFVGQPYQTLNFAEYSDNALTLIISSEALKHFEREGKSAGSYVQQWVQVSGTLTSNEADKCSGIRPQIWIEKPANIEILTYDEAQWRLGRRRRSAVEQRQVPPQHGLQPAPPVIFTPPIRPGGASGLQVSTNQLDFGIVCAGHYAVQSLEIINRSPISMVIFLGELPSYLEVKPDRIICPYGGKVPMQIKLKSDQIPSSMLSLLCGPVGSEATTFQLKGAEFTIKWGNQVQTIYINAVVVVNATGAKPGASPDRLPITLLSPTVMSPLPKPNPVLVMAPKPPPTREIRVIGNKQAKATASVFRTLVCNGQLGLYVSCTRRLTQRAVIAVRAFFPHAGQGWRNNVKPTKADVGDGLLNYWLASPRAEVQAKVHTASDSDLEDMSRELIRLYLERIKLLGNWVSGKLTDADAVDAMSIMPEYYLISRAQLEARLAGRRWKNAAPVCKGT